MAPEFSATVNPMKPVKNLMTIKSITLFLLAALSLHAEEWVPTKDEAGEPTINGRAMETFHHGVKPEWGYAAPQQDTFIVVHPTAARKNAPLYVVLHSAGHDVFSCVNCTKTVGNHDIYRAPDDHFALYVDCRKNKGDWWWGGMHLRDKGLTSKNSGGDPMPVEKRVMDTVAWVMKTYEIDPNRVYLSGNSMGGSGTLGIGMRHGDVFAAIKANVPAGIEHVSNRMYFPPQSVPGNVTLPEPPVCIDYSGQNDGWSAGHDRFAQAMNDRKYALYLYWGPFGHANNSAKIMEVNDLIDSFDWLGIKRNEAYAVFTNASNNSKLPWPDDLKNAASGQVNAFFRWRNVIDTADQFETELFLVSAKDLKTTFEIPNEASADVTLRRLQEFQLKPGTAFEWTFSDSKGEGAVDGQGLITIAGLKITGEPVTLRIKSK
jgi:predicted esterase